MAETKVLKAEMYNEVIKTLEMVDGTEELVAFVDAELQRHLNRQEKAKARAAKKKAEADELLAIVLDAVKNIGVPATRDEVTDEVAANYEGDLEITPAKVGARLTKLVKAGEIDKESRTIDKSRKMVYAIAGAFESDDDDEE